MLSYLKGAAAAAIAMVALVACSQNGAAPDAAVTLQQIQNSIKATCNYVPTINSIAAVAATVTTAIDPAAGAAATVAVAVGSALVTDICKAVQAQSSKMAGKKGEAQTMDVTVNGVEVHGTLVAPENKT